MTGGLVIEQLWRYPVKSMQGEEVRQSSADAKGLKGDRQWGVLDVATGTTLTGRRCPELLFVSARYDATRDDVEVVLPNGYRTLSDFLGREVRIVRAGTGAPGRYEIASDFEREDSSPWISWEGPAQTFHDSGRTAISMLSFGSMASWEPRRFRANVVVSGAGEMDLSGCRLRFGSVEVRAPKVIDRCVMVTRAQPGIDRDLEVLRTINRASGGNLGLSLLVDTPGWASVGDAVHLLDD